MRRTSLIAERDPAEVAHGTTLGHLRLRNVETNEIILIPTPSANPNDPLNWSKAYRIYLTFVVTAAVFFCNFLAAGPTVAIVEITIDFFGPPGPTFMAHIAKIAYIFTATVLAQGVSNLFWMPFILKYGRRPLYIIAFVGYTATAVWCGAATSYGSELAARIFIGLFSGLGECIGPLTISDIFFLHERGLYMAIFTAALSNGVSGGILVSGLITIGLDWRYIYWITVALLGALTLLVFFTMPETAFNRGAADVHTDLHAPSQLYADGLTPIDTLTAKLELPGHHTEDSGSGLSSPAVESAHKKKTYIQNLKLFHGTLTEESLWRMFYRPIVLLALPTVLWATLVMSVTIGFLVGISSNFAPAFAANYGFSSWQSGLCFIAGIIGAVIGIYFGGSFSDNVADYFTKKNGGIREPEMRLPAMAIGMITSPLALVLYGVGIQHKLHWIVPTIALALLNFSIASLTNITLVYVVDSFRPIAGECIVTQLGFKAAFGFLLSFYTNPWIAESGYQNSFGAMAGISGGIIALWIPFYFFGRSIRRASLRWGFVVKLVGWNEDREVGE